MSLFEFLNDDDLEGLGTGKDTLTIQMTRSHSSIYFEEIADAEESLSSSSKPIKIPGLSLQINDAPRILLDDDYPQSLPTNIPVSPSRYVANRLLSQSLTGHSLGGSRSGSLTSLSSSPPVTGPSRRPSYVESVFKDAFFVSAFSAHQVVTIASGMFRTMFKGIERPTWSLASNMNFPYLTIGLGRADWAMPLFGQNQVHIKVDMDVILEYEREGSQNIRSEHARHHPVPEEHTEFVQEQGHKVHSLSGEWFYPTEEETKLYLGPNTSQARPYTGKTILYIHGGAYILGSVPLYRMWTQRLAVKTNFRVFSVEYRLCPEFPFPAGLHDALIAYVYLIQPHHPMFLSIDTNHLPISPKDIVVMGDSAGGGLSMALLNYLNLYLRDAVGRHLFPLPGGAVLFSPWVDLTCLSKSWRDNVGLDWLPAGTGDIHNPLGPDLQHPVYSYILGEAAHPSNYNVDPTELVDLKSYQRDLVDKLTRHPLVSPVFAEDFRGLPPILLQVGDCEFLRDESLALSYKIQNSNKGARKSWIRHELYTDMVHCFHAAQWLPQSKVAMMYINAFLSEVFYDTPKRVHLSEEHKKLVKIVDLHLT